MGSLTTLIKWAILLPVLVAVVLIAVANHHSVTVHLNPFDPADPVLKTERPLYQIGFILFVLGALSGGLVVWLGQHRYRREARRSRYETVRRPPAAGGRPPRPADAPPSSSGRLLPRPNSS
jgi:hypothetical protein